jgi:UDP-MurNAc hydroxylase
MDMEHTTMFFRILSHASLLVRSRNKTLLTDPWLVGSCYWRSWWNYPPVKLELIQNLQPDAIYITHIHWDHFHGATLRRFSKNTPIVIPFERSTRMKRDLMAMGFLNVIEVRHGKSFTLHEDFKLTSYQFSPWGDSAVVIESEGISLLNANDAKFMGGPLQQILNNHKRFDFAFRSHSSANDRVCHHYTDNGMNKQENPTVYADSFFNFMEKVNPKYAVPFASNQCYLHRDVFRLNTTVETPSQVQAYVASVGGFSESDLKVMVSGDSWDSETGFHIEPNDWFSDRPHHLLRYLEEKKDKLESTYAVEDKSRVCLKEVQQYFRLFFDVVPFFLRFFLKNRPVVLCAKYGGGADYFMVDVYRGRVAQITSDLPPTALVFETAALILRKAMALNMFSHIGISKRVVYKTIQKDAKYILRFNVCVRGTHLAHGKQA